MLKANPRTRRTAPRLLADPPHSSLPVPPHRLVAVAAWLSFLPGFCFAPLGVQPFGSTSCEVQSDHEKHNILTTLRPMLTFAGPPAFRLLAREQKQHDCTPI